MKTALLDLDRTPTLEELKEFFKANDFSSAKYYDENDLSDSDKSEIKEMSSVFHNQWESLTKEKGLKSNSAYYGNNNPLIQMEQCVSNLVSEGVFKLIVEQPEKAAAILEQFSDEFCEEEKADKLLKNSVDTLMNVMDYENLAKIIQSAPTQDDFSNKPNNYRQQDFHRKWNHTRSGIKTVSKEALEEVVNEQGENAGFELQDTGTNVENEVLGNITAQEFLSSISLEDRKILMMKMSGKTQSDIAKELGYKTHSAITKRLAKLKGEFLETIK